MRLLVQKKKKKEKKKEKKEKKFKTFLQAFARKFSWISFICVIYRVSNDYAQND